MVLTLKAVWTSESGESEIRRVTVGEDTINRYSLLAEKVIKLFPQLTGQIFQLGWKDSEGDHIVMSSDEELAQAVANTVENQIIKVFITTKTSKHADKKKPNPPVSHPHVICDGCNGNVCGYRYKCLECFDYDLCEKCHEEDKHPGHDMLKICTPVGQPHNWMFPGWRRMYRSMFGQHPFGKRCGRRAESKHGEETDKKGAAYEHIPPSAFLNGVGKAVATFFENLGVGVDVLVSEDEGDASGFNSNKKEAESQPAAEETEPKNMADDSVKSDVDNKNDDADNKNDTSEVSNEQSANTAAPQNEDSAAELSAQGARPKNYGLFQRSDSGCEANLIDSRECREPSPDFNGHDGWTVVNDVKDEQNDTVVKPSVPCEKVSYPELPDEKMPSDVGAQSTILTHPDPKIANALSKMCAMGFTNEGGWLVRLLETKNGNINDVLDALYPNRH